MENLILKKWRFYSMRIELINSQIEECSIFNFLKKRSLQQEKVRYIRKQRMYSQLLSEANFW